jgi:hypothetical protein
MKRFLSAQLTGCSVLASALLMVASPVGAQTMKEGKAMSSGDEACQHRMMKQGAKHLTQMKAKLHLTPQQLPAWEAFSQTMNTIPAGMGGMGGMQDASAMEKMTAMHKRHMQG